jgi:hypothetical protein
MTLRDDASKSNATGEEDRGKVFLKKPYRLRVRVAGTGTSGQH